MKILLVQTSFLGDTILSTPLIAAIKKLYPQSELWMMTTAQSRDLVANDPLLSGVIVFDKAGKDRGLAGLWRKAREIRGHDFAAVYSLHRSYRTSLLLWLARIPLRIGFVQSKLSFLYNRRVERESGVHEVLRNLSLLKFEGGSRAGGECLEDVFDAELRLFPDPKIEVERKIPELTSARRAVIVPGSVWKTKRWKQEGYSEVAQYLAGLGMQVVLLGAPSESEICRAVASQSGALNLVGRTSLAESIAVMKNAEIVVCNDSMSLHMASALKIPNVSIFCATSPKFGFGPWRNKALVVEKVGLSCKPCRRHGGNRCPTGTEACMRDLPSSEVIAAIGKLAVSE